MKMFNKKQFKCGIVFILFMPFILFSETINDSKLSNTPSCSQVSYNNVARLSNMSSRPIAPNWVERKKYWKEQFKDSFSPPKVGTYKKIKLINGVTQYGKIIELTDKTLKIRINNQVTISYRNYQLIPISRVIFFKSDFVKHNVNLKINEEKFAFHQKLTEFFTKQKLNIKNARREKIKYLINHSDLILGENHCRRLYDNLIVEGQVKNISGHKLQNILAVISFYSADNKFVTSASGAVEYNPILSDQTTPFTVYAKWNPTINKFKISFKILSGGTILFIKKKDLSKLKNGLLDDIDDDVKEIDKTTVNSNRLRYTRYGVPNRGMIVSVWIAREKEKKMRRGRLPANVRPIGGKSIKERVLDGRKRIKLKQQNRKNKEK